MKHLIIIISLCLLGITEILSQLDFREGYIIKNNNDTIYGLIAYNGNQANSKKCIFKKESNSDIQKYTPKELKAFRFIDSKYYVSKIIKPRDRETLLFLEYLINGIVDIYYYRDNLAGHYLIDNGDGNLYELKNEQNEIIIDGTTYIQNTKEYIGMLKYSFKESPTISKKAENCSLDHKSLIKISQEYHNEVCSDKECIIYEKKLPNITLDYGLLFGLNNISTSVSNNFPAKYYYLRNIQFEEKLHPSIGLFCKINMPYIHEKLYVQYEVTYNQFSLKTINIYEDPIYNMTRINNINYSQKSINNTILIKYEFLKGKVRPTINIGGFENYSFITNYIQNLEVKYSWGDTKYTDEINESPFSKIIYGINIGLGVIGKIQNKREINVDLTYQRGFGLLSGLNLNYLLLKFGFQINK